MTTKPMEHPRKPRNWPSIVGSVEDRASKGFSRLEDITRLVSDWVWETNTDIKLTYVSDRVVGALGFLPDELLGKTFQDIGVFESPTGVLIDFDFTEPFRHVQFRTKSKDGEEAIFLISGLPFYDRKTGAFEGYCGTAQDITAQRREARALREARREADQANRAKSEFLSSASHELRTPLNGILGFAELMMMDKRTPLLDAQKETLSYILQSGRHLLTLIDEILDLAKVESGSTVAEMQSSSLSDIFAEMIPTIEVMAEKHGIKLYSPPIRRDEYTVYIDPKLLQQILMNLLSNAIKYNTEDGKVTISTKVVNNGFLRITVEDTGVGIPMEVQESVFQPFNRLGATQSGIQGTGIGLTITKNLVELIDGKIGFESTLGKGSAFWVEIHLAPS